MDDAQPAEGVPTVSFDLTDESVVILKSNPLELPMVCGLCGSQYASAKGELLELSLPETQTSEFSHLSTARTSTNNNANNFLFSNTESSCE